MDLHCNIAHRAATLHKFVSCSSISISGGVDVANLNGGMALGHNATGSVGILLSIKIHNFCDHLDVCDKIVALLISSYLRDLLDYSYYLDYS